jgi:predicted DNA binding protein
MAHANSKLTDDQVAAVANEYQQGATGAQLAEKYGVSTNTVFNALRRAGVEIRPRGRRAAA